MKVNYVSASHTFFTSDYLLLGQHFGSMDYKNKGYPLGIAASYNRALDSRNHIGFAACYERQTGVWQPPLLTYTYKYGNTYMSYPVGHFLRESFTLATEYTHSYVSHRYFRLYTVAGLAATFVDIAQRYDSAYYNRNFLNGTNKLGAMQTHRRNSHFNGYYSPIGLSVGGDLIWFIEVGFGFKGIMNSGVAYKFH